MTNPFPTIQDLAEKNAGASPGFKPKLTLQDLMSRNAMAVISCMDPRADPKDFWGIEAGMPPGVIRNAGGRAADALRSLEVLSALGEGLSAVAVVHHTHCGVGPHGIDDAYIKRTLPGRMRGSSSALEEKHWDSFKHQTEEESVREDMKLIVADKLLPKDVQVFGFVLDVETNRTTEVRL
ncbi:hypothetical protein DPSP01_000472 [Paraphaeosphaeria sporulosa]|uniref:Carbonic anhydrase n=1 Tax=Paraphaeosphaeria sporulosa TaxID=1460663 RepID=A0A177C8X9_9PLEO|nr:uncharacterized protein CC84DRAFT_1206924 [Paraphaeosphaeria sporulosa]OAG03581.1 hypothetical protein CC84DRAFT_1206924 [Paraphaeosphaeria sporulosa]